MDFVLSVCYNSFIPCPTFVASDEQFLYSGGVDSVFEIDATDLRWLEGVSENEDLCLHGNAVAKISDEIFEYDNATVSATALYLLKSLTEDHIQNSVQMLPCCGFNIYASDDMCSCVIVGCPDGIDWSVIHIGDDIIKLVTKSGKETLITLDEYRKTVYSFADKIETYYKKSVRKRLPDDAVNRDGYIAFWNEWHRHRK